ncbi:ReO_6 protein [Elysia marginata]|uniref:ReO_6 protein n=1 Tax=Elysia marginata TaxID=1093978 RepID=A0AAV4I9T0_9GAST|nr:ReO_6 protein [Elysia marginata]
MFTIHLFSNLGKEDANWLHNKTDQLFTRIENDNDFKNVNVFCITETWLDSQPDEIVKPPGYFIFRHDRDKIVTEKKDGGGVCFLISDKWCRNVKIISKCCTKNIEYLTIKCRPYYLPREFSSVTLTAVYIHPQANNQEALNDLRSTITNNENRDPDTLSIISDDFNQANLTTVLPDYNQNVTCPTRGKNTLDHCYCKIKQAYMSFERSGLGNSDHSCVLLLPKYK